MVKCQWEVKNCNTVYIFDILEFFIMKNVNNYVQYWTRASQLKRWKNKVLDKPQPCLRSEHILKILAILRLNILIQGSYKKRVRYNAIIAHDLDQTSSYRPR